MPINSTPEQLNNKTLESPTLTGTVTLDGTINGTTATVAHSTPATASFTGGLHIVTNTTNGNDIVDLPTNVTADIGKAISLYASEAFELRTADNSATINNVTAGDTNEAAIAAGALVECVCTADNTWICKYWIADGTPTQLVPDGV